MRSPFPASQGPCPAAKRTLSLLQLLLVPAGLPMGEILHDHHPPPPPLPCRETHCPVNHRSLGSGPRPPPPTSNAATPTFPA